MITITQETENGYYLKSWVFYFNISIHSSSIIIDKYFESSRLTTKHKYKIEKRWNRVDSRHNDFTDEEIMNGITPDVIKEAKDLLKQEIDKIGVSL